MIWQRLHRRCRFAFPLSDIVRFYFSLFDIDLIVEVRLAVDVFALLINVDAKIGMSAKLAK